MIQIYYIIIIYMYACLTSFHIINLKNWKELCSYHLWADNSYITFFTLCHTSWDLSLFCIFASHTMKAITCSRWGSNSQPPHLILNYKYGALTDCATGAGNCSRKSTIFKIPAFNFSDQGCYLGLREEQLIKCFQRQPFTN